MSKITGQTAWLLRRLRAFKVQADLDRLFLYLSGLETAFITAYRLIRKNRRGIGENDDGRVSLLGLRLPVQDDRDVRGRAFVCGEIDQEPLAIGGRGIILLVEAQR